MKIKHFLRVLSSLLYTSLRHKVFSFKGHKIDYVYKKGKNHTLVIVFPAVAKKAKYNYVLTLKNIDSHVLFLNDEFDGGFSYFIGTYGDFFCVDLVDELLLKIQQKHRIDKIICLGSSKGGTSALIYSLKTAHTIDKVIIGSPQYSVGEYLYNHGGQQILKHICGCVSLSEAQKLDEFCRQTVLNTRNSPSIILFSSSSEDEFHLKETDLLIHDLEEKGLSFIFVDGHFIGHAGLASAFKDFLCKNIRELQRQ